MEKAPHYCNICSCQFTDDDNGVIGTVNLWHVEFCPTCFAGILELELENRVLDDQHENLLSKNN